MRLPVLTNSQMRCFRRCAREHHYTYELGYRPVVEDEALSLGSLAHHGLEAWWKASDGEDRLGAALRAIEGHQRDDFELAKVQAMLGGYHTRWEPDMVHYEVLAVEAEFRAPLLNPETGARSRTYDLAGKLDVVVRDLRDMLTKLVEHKTTSEDVSPGSPYWQRLLMDPQISTYYAGGKASGYDIAECIYDVLGKPGLRPAKATPPEKRQYTKAGKLYAKQRERDETADEYRERLVSHIADQPERYYRRAPVVRLEAEELDAAHDAWVTARLIREAELAGRHPRNPDSCERYGRFCTFFGVCTGTASLDDPERFRRTEHVHEELTEAA